MQPSSMAMCRLSEDLSVLWPQSVSIDLSHFTTLDIWAFNIHGAQCGAPSRPCALALSLYPTRALSRFTRYFEGRSSTISPSGVLTMHQSQIHPNMASATPQAEQIAMRSSPGISFRSKSFHNWSCALVVGSFSAWLGVLYVL